jgi:septum formation protein
MHLILASGSPRRRELLAEAGYDIEVVVPSETAECGACSNTGPAELVRELAVQKAADVVARLLQIPQFSSDRTKRAVVVAADTVAECQGQILGKPRDEDHAREMLRLLSGREHRVYTGVCVWPLSTGRGDPAGDFQVELDITTLRMDALSEGQLEDYLAGGQWRGKAGAFGYQDRLGWVHVIEGSESNVVGLPLERLERMLAAVERECGNRGERE